MREREFAAKAFKWMVILQIKTGNFMMILHLIEVCMMIIARDVRILYRVASEALEIIEGEARMLE